jgi:hypothetical protein
MEDKLPDLPPSKSKFWDKAEVNMSNPRSLGKCEHYFIRKSGTQIECRNCYLGFFVGKESELRDGKWYAGGRLMLAS